GPARSASDRYTYLSDTEYRGQIGELSYGLATGVVVCQQKSLRPIAWFAAVKPTDGESRFLSLLSFKTPAGFNAGGRQFSTNGHGSSETGAEGTTVARWGKKEVEVAYEFATDPKTHAVRRQSLTIGGRKVGEGEPRVFIVDVAGELVMYTPVKVELPKGAPDASREKGEAWGAAVERAIEQLRKDSPELGKLLGGSAGPGEHP